MRQRELTALTRKRIAAAAVARLDAAGSYDASFANVGLAVARELGIGIPSRDDTSKPERIALDAIYRVIPAN